MNKEIQILLIEDNLADTRLIDIYLKEAFSENYSFTNAERLSDALMLLKRRHYDVVLCDLSLPDNSGIDTFAKVLAACPDSPIIVLTGYGDEEFAIKAVSQGAADFLGKNDLDSNLLQRSIIYGIERHNAQKHLRKIAELQAGKELAEHAAKTRQEFLSVMSHEIRTPLNAIIGITQLLMEDHPAPSQKENLNILQFSAHNLLVLVNNILDFSRIESGKIQLEKIPFNLSSLVHRVAGSFRHNAKEKHLQFKVQIENNLPEMIVGDPTRLTQVLNNLLHNAIKFTEKGEVVLTVASLAQKENKIELVFEVTDTGIGIELSRLDEIFESFTQARSSTTRMFGGTGLGLTICKQLVKIMSGDMTVESVEGKGSAFRFSLPFLVASDEQITQPLALHDSGNTHDHLKGVKILVVEDNTTSSMLMEKFLTRWGATVEIAEDGNSAVEKVKSAAADSSIGSHFDLVLMDLQMPGMNGFEANKKIREMGFSADELPVIALTAYTMDEDKKRVSEAGMNDHIAKPVDLRELYTKIIKNISHKSFSANETFFDKLPQKHILSLTELLDSFEDDDFRRQYLGAFEKEFREFPGKISATVNKNDIEAFSLFVHKITPSVQRLRETGLADHLSDLKILISSGEKDNAAIESLIAKVEKSCAAVCDNVVEIRNKYFHPVKMEKQSSL